MISVFLRKGITCKNSKTYSKIALPFMEIIDFIFFKINKEATRKSVLYISLL